MQQVQSSEITQGKRPSGEVKGKVHREQRLSFSRSGHVVYLPAIGPQKKEDPHETEDDLQTQFKQAMVKVREILRWAGLTTQNVKKVVVYLTHLDCNLPEVEQLCDDSFVDSFAVFSFVGVRALSHGARVQLEVTAEDPILMDYPPRYSQQSGEQ